MKTFLSYRSESTFDCMSQHLCMKSTTHNMNVVRKLYRNPEEGRVVMAIYVCMNVVIYFYMRIWYVEAFKGLE